jgi:hypothetical protein
VTDVNSICIDGAEYQMMGMGEFVNAVARTPSGQPFVYFIGELSRACEVGNSSIAGWSEMKKVASRARSYQRQGYLVLTQRRVAPYRFEYRATVTNETARREDSRPDEN